MNEGWIKLHRKITQWEWYGDTNTFRLFIHCLLRANHQPRKWQGTLIEKGQFITSLEHLSREMSGRHSTLSVQQIRTSLTKLISTGEITSKSTNKYRLISIHNYHLYQSDDRQTNSQITGKQQASNRQVTTNKNDKKEIREEEIPPIDFKLFWELYPKKVERKKTEIKWYTFDVFIQSLILADLPKRSKGWKWKKDGGRFIENPLTYLNGARWEDQIELENNKQTSISL